MNRDPFHIRLQASLGIIFFLCLFIQSGSPNDCTNESSLYTLLPVFDQWEMTESPQRYFPDTLFEYINGAAEAYLSYDFNELIVAQYKRQGTEETLAVEIYDMGNTKNSFGIYGAERFIESEFVSIGTQGYVEEGLLNFLIGRYYIKLLCFDCETDAESFLRGYAEEIVKRAKEKAQFPALLGSFPEEGRVPYSEKFILKNFMGYEFFHDGYIVNYALQDLFFDCFLIEGFDSEDAQEMLDKYTKIKDADRIQSIPFGYRVRDPYYHNIYIARTDKYICGVIKIKDDFEKVGERYLKWLLQTSGR